MPKARPSTGLRNALTKQTTVTYNTVNMGRRLRVTASAA